MKKIIVAMAFMLLGFSLFAQNTQNLLQRYNDVKNALVKSESETASKAILSFHEAIKAEKNFTQKAELITATQKLSKAKGLEKQRAAFNDLSKNLWNVVKGTEKLPQEVYYQYCPMKKAYWLSLEKDIKNPYYGSSMLTCGEVVETKS